MFLKDARDIIAENHAFLDTSISAVELDLFRGRSGVEKMLKARATNEFGELAYEKSTVENRARIGDPNLYLRHNVVILSDNEARQIIAHVNRLEEQLKEAIDKLESGL